MRDVNRVSVCTGTASGRRSREACVIAYLFCALLLAGCGDSGSALLLDGEQRPDPAVVDYPLVYVERRLPREDDGALTPVSIREPAAFHGGADLRLRDRTSPSAPERSLTSGLFEAGALYDVKDLSTSFDGNQLLFALRAPEEPDLDDDEQPTWNIWLYDLTSGDLRRLIESDIQAEDGDDVAPAFLPDGRIVFSSNRQRASRALLLDEGRPQYSGLDESRNVPAFVLHVMNADGSEIEQLSFNQSHDLDPTVLADGRVAYSRWDNAGPRDRVLLHTLTPHGFDMQLLYGAHSLASGPEGERVDLRRPQPLPDGGLLVLQRNRSAQGHWGGVPVRIDVDMFVDLEQPVHGFDNLADSAQQFLVPEPLTTGPDPRSRGRFAHAYALHDGSGRLLVAWSQCRLQRDDAEPDDISDVAEACSTERLTEPGWTEATPRYGLWMLSPGNGTQLPVVLPGNGRSVTEGLVMEPRPYPPVLPMPVAGIDLDLDLVANGLGILDIGSVYDVDGALVADVEALRDPAQMSADERPARFLRLFKPVPIPDDDVVDVPATAFGVSQAQLMREIIGYTPIQPDGSVQVQVPADTAFSFDVLDGHGRRISDRHYSWLQLRPGETLHCQGCHTADSTVPHGRRDAEPPAAYAGAELDGQSFPNTRPELFADSGETMAQVWARLQGTPAPALDVQYADVWTDPAVRAPDEAMVLSYQDLATDWPASENCVLAWSSLCRATIHYPDHIHVLWTLPRELSDADGLPVDRTCTACHSPVDDMGQPRVPEADLDLSDGDSPIQADHLHSYRQLTFVRPRLELEEGVLLPRQVQATDAQGNPIYETNEDGDLILDGEGDPIPVMIPVTAAPVLSPVGARASQVRFFSRFDAGGDHEGWLTDAELRLVSEWLDLGAQYYNDPFRVPQE